MQFDLHCHTTASDGRLTPNELADAVAALDLEVFALTDHDTIDGYAALKAEGKLKAAKHWVSGIEFSCVALKQTIHIVGLDFDEHLVDRSRHELANNHTLSVPWKIFGQQRA